MESGQAVPALLSPIAIPAASPATAESE